jgi:uncharacterized membrane protein
MTNGDGLHRLERNVGRLLWIGMATSSTALAIGLVAFLIAPQARPTSALLNAGLLILIAMPIVRVLMSVAEYVRMRDWPFALITLAVLVELSVTVVYAFQR